MKRHGDVWLDERLRLSGAIPQVPAPMLRVGSPENWLPREGRRSDRHRLHAERSRHCPRFPRAKISGFQQNAGRAFSCEAPIARGFPLACRNRPSAWRPGPQATVSNRVLARADYSPGLDGERRFQVIQSAPVARLVGRCGSHSTIRILVSYLQRIKEASGAVFVFLPSGGGDFAGFCS